MLYVMRDAHCAMLSSARAWAATTRLAFDNPFSPFAYLPQSRALAASCEMFERGTRSYAKPAFNLPASERVVWERPFCRVIAFGEPSAKPEMLIVAPMSGHDDSL